MDAKKEQKTSSIESIISYASVAAGAYHGYCDAYGIELGKGYLEALLTYGPSAVQACTHAVKPGITGLTFGGLLGGIWGLKNTREGAIAKVAAGAAIGTAAGAGVGAAVGGIKGGLQTAVGYGIGYLIGYLSK